LLQERKVRALFKAVDTDGSGSVTPEELRGAMATFGLVRNRHFCAIYIRNRSFCQDRLGTNIGKTQK
jgi:Ca2+-binding EF-hand superfamily protein